MAKKKSKPLPVVFGTKIDKINLDSNWSSKPIWEDEIVDPTTLIKAIKTDRLNRAKIIIMDNLPRLDVLFVCKLVDDHWDMWRKLYG